MLNIAINPGSGPVEGGSPEVAFLNTQRLIVDVAARYPGTHVKVVPAGREEEGRWVFDLTITRRDKTVELDVEMPGLPLDKVRWMKEPGQNIWDFPRLYVDGSSWVWYYAIDAIGSHPFEEN